ncbi:hypothetical protein FNF28_06885 [Cafeteria roenbergensis]|uniref:Calnexin n=1 Tax=Cafeteria roenbergensis TaxID=33653 RepID=A0A5A8CLD7_CAFRO|nr:hypothetical protein FNF28_06885 [Cafeteria roenbergensis]
MLAAAALGRAEEAAEAAKPLLADATPESFVFFEGFQGETHAFVRTGHSAYGGKNVSAAPHSVAGGPEGDKMLTLFEGAAEAQHPLKYGMVAMFDKALDLSEGDEPLVLQYEHRPQNGMVCDGGYAKVLLADPDAGNIPMVTSASVSQANSGVDISKPEYYGVMFGPDKCGMTNKVHFIMRHKSPKTGKWSEHHLKSPPPVAEGTNTALYTLVLRPADNTFEVRVNGEVKRQGSILEELEPPINPPKEIDDPTDSKPADWVDDAKIKDPEASKPDDWDEDAPPTIPDEEAVKPAAWLDDEEPMVPDPTQTVPEEWDEEEDGEWQAPFVPNPKCEAAPGCGKWIRPTKKNPAYKGKWVAPLIDNPAYKGEWKPRRIENPGYFLDEHPARKLVLSGLMFEVMINTGGIAFDNVLVSQDEASSSAFTAATWAIENADQTAAAKEERLRIAREARLKLLEEGGLWNTAQYYFGELSEFVESHLVLSVVVASLVIVASTVYCFTLPTEPDLAMPEGEYDEYEEDGPTGTAHVGGRAAGRQVQAAGVGDSDAEEEEEEEEAADEDEAEAEDEAEDEAKDTGVRARAGARKDEAEETAE